MARRVWIALAALLSLTAPATADEAALAVILAGIAAEEAAPRKQARLVFVSGDVETHYLIERILPGRLHMHAEKEGREQEIIVVGDTLYVREASGWTATPALAAPATPFSVAGLFRDRMDNIAELDALSVNGVEHRVFRGTINWFAGRHRNEGEITVFIERSSGLLRRMVFDGRCGERTCAFDQTIDYDPAVEIEPPVR